MNPSSIALKDELSELDAPLLLHLHDEAEQTAVVGPVTSNNIGRTAEDVVAILGTTHQGVELLAAVATTDHNRLAPRFAYGVEELVY